VRFFLDNCIAPAMAEALTALARAQGIEVFHLSQLFDRATTDVVWIQSLRQEGDWIIISGDLRITKSPAEREAWRESGLTAFFLADNWSSRKFWVQAPELIRWFPIIVETAKSCNPGSGFLLKFQGTKPEPLYRSRS
jgi:hypothetical protein